MVYWHIETDYIAVAIFILLLFKAAVLNKEKNLTDRIYFFSLIVGLLGTATDIVSSAIMNDPRSWWSYEAGMVIYLLFAPLVTLVWIIYTASIIHTDRGKMKRTTAIFTFPYIFYALLCLTNPLHELLFSLTPDLVYSRGPLFLWMVVGSQMLYAAMGTIMVLINWKSIVPKSTAWTLLILYISSTSTYWIQIAHPGWLIICASYAIAFLVCDTSFETRQREELYQRIQDALKMAEDGNQKLQNMNEELQTANDALQQEMAITGAISSMYCASYTVDVETGIFREVNVTPEIHEVIGTSGAIKQLRHGLVEDLVDEGFRREMDDFLDFSTLEARMEESGSVSLEFLGKLTGWNRINFIEQSRDASGKLEKVICAIKHIDSEKKQKLEYQKRLKEAADEANRANRVKSDFLANMSHEIRTPLNTVSGLTEIIMRESTEKNIQEYAADIQRAGSYLLSIINDVLDISKIESGKMELHESRYELGSLINDSYNMVAARCREKGLSISVTCNPALPCMLWGDEYRLRQVLVNLLSNAVKYTNEGGLELHVSGEENTDILRLEAKVKDTGIGIKEEDMPLLFHKFSRLEMEKNRQIEGTGLGLSITKELVGLMNGEITVESVYGVGTTFTVRVPQKIVDRTPIGDIYMTYLDIQKDIEQYKQSFEAPDACILAVDDVPINLQVIRRLLQATRIQVDTAKSGKECLKKVCEKAYDLILMDHMMPEMDGLETMKVMNSLDASLNKDVPVVMLTANAMQGAREEYFAQGFVDYLSKPVRGARLEDVILKYLPEDKVTRKAKLPEPPSRTDELPSRTDEPPSRTDEPPLSFENLKKELPELDTAAGLAYCAGDQTFYCSILTEFAESGRDRKLEEAYHADDWDAYRIEIHSLKSTAKMLGLTQLSEECARLEQAVKKGNNTYISENHADVIEHYRRASAKLLHKLYFP